MLSLQKRASNMCTLDGLSEVRVQEDSLGVSCTQMVRCNTRCIVTYTYKYMYFSIYIYIHPCIFKGQCSIPPGEDRWRNSHVFVYIRVS